MNTYPLFSKLSLFIILCSFRTISFAQNSGIADLIVQQNHQTSFSAATDNNQNYREEVIFTGGSSPSTSSKKLYGAYVIPLVFHIVSQSPSPITDAQIINAVQDLNDAFAHTGVYGSGFGTNTGISFCLARVDPNGGITNGITRTVSSLGNVDQDIEDTRLKNLVSWDTKQYCNIWLVDSVQAETLNTFACGNWSKVHEAGYSTLTGDYREGIVVTGFGTLLAHEMGHYLGLLHTFSIKNCQNTNCNTDGDGVCDTPPQSVPGGSCTAPQNSCSSDTLSGFTTDVPDLNSNFMSYSGACTNEFTPGQAAKMINNLTTVHAGLLAQDKCTPPCGENIVAGFTRDKWSPAIGDNINFTSNSTGGTNYQWSVNGANVGGNSAVYAQTFAAAGKYKVMLKVYNANPGCYATYTDYVIVGCGVTARFNPDQRIIASRTGSSLDSVVFTNHSIGASAYKWLIGNDRGMVEQVVGTSPDLTYIFPYPAHYTIRLIATNGTCSDTTDKFTLTVLDPTPDGYLNFYDIQCYQETKIKVTLSACNNGYGPLTPNIPLSFYDADPTTGHANKLTTVNLGDSIYGKCCGPAHTYILDINRQGYDTLYAVLNDDGTTVPLVMPNPNNTHEETNYINNIVFKQNFQFKVTAVPPTATLEPGDTLQLMAQGTPGSLSSPVWSPAEGLSCTNCTDPIFIAGKKDIIKKISGVNSYGCADSGYSIIKVPPADDFTITIDSIYCFAHDSLLAKFTLCNQFKRGILPATLKVSFYNGDPSVAGARLLAPPFIITVDDSVKCASFTHVFTGVDSAKIFAVVNDSGSVSTPVTFPQDTLMREKNYTNNFAASFYGADTFSLQPADTTVFVGSSFTIGAKLSYTGLSSFNWDNSNGYTLSCYDCPLPTAVIAGNSFVKVKAANQYGCTISAKTNIRVIPPDMTVQILQTACYTNDSLMVKFNICMNNNYDSVISGLPVSFYESKPSDNAVLLGTFFTQQKLPGNCNTYTAVIKSPTTQNIFAVVNDGGKNLTAPDTLFAESDYTNNIADTTIVPFVVTASPADTSITRSTPVQITAQVSGGETSSIKWEPLNYLSCTDCLAPIAQPAYPLQYKITVTNEYACTASATVNIKTSSNGPIDVSIPNVFTPNGDGHNDVFFILTSTHVQMVKSFSIFDRWGKKVFAVNNIPPNDPSFGWNGNYEGRTANDGTYVYVAVIAFVDGHEEVYKGTVTLIR